MPAMSRFAISTVEVRAPNGVKSLWVAALPRSEAVAAVRQVIPPYTVELSIQRFHRNSKLGGLRPGEVREIEPMSHPKCPSDSNLLPKPAIDIATGERPNSLRTLSEYRAYAIGIDGRFTGCNGMICRDDGEAVAKAKRIISDYDIEVWSGNRFVIRLVH